MPSRLSAFPPNHSVAHGRPLIATAARDKALSGFTASPPVVIQSAWAMLIGFTFNIDTVSFVLQDHCCTEKNCLKQRNHQVSSQLRQIEVTVDKKKTVTEFFNHVETQWAAGCDAGEQKSLPYILQLGQCGLGQLPSDACKGTVDAKWEQKLEGNVALVIACAWKASELSVIGRYNEQMLRMAEVNRILDQFVHLVSVLSESTGKATLGKLQVCGPEDISQIRQWNTKCPEPIMQLAHGIITSQARRRPDALAVRAWDARLTYGEMDSFSDSLAQRLLLLGVKPDSLIPFCMEKSAWAIVAMLGILKAGAAFVALDPAHPLERLSGILERIQAEVLLTSESSIERMRSLKPTAVVVSQPELVSPLGDSTQLLSTVTPNNLAYVIFTSGSTGAPKGVMIEHHSLVQSCLDLAARMGSSSETRMLQFSSFTFDASILEIFPTLFSGGCVCMPSDSDRVDNLVVYINDNSVDLVFLTPSIARLLEPRSIPTVHTLVTGGEAFSGDTLKAWLKTRSVLNAYGPSEITIACNMAQLSVELPTKCIGRAINTLSWVVDPNNHDRLAPLGCVGELLVQGHTLARGYFQDDEKTAALFIEAPEWYSDFELLNTASKFYKTGDLVRYESDGSLLYIGRKDSQIKVRGQRVELGEIEHHIFATGKVSQALVLFPPSGVLKHRLVGVLVLKEDTRADFDGQIRPLGEEAGSRINQIRDLLSRSLPQYMVPTHLIAVQSLPLLPSGKIDRKSLVRWAEDVNGSSLKTIKTKPQVSSECFPVSSIERSLQQIVGDVLNIPVGDIDLQQSYLSMGGDSISAMQIVSRCRAKGIEIATRNILSSKSISDMARHVSLSTIQILEDPSEEESDEKFELSPMQKMYFSLVPNGDNEFNQSFLLKLRGDVDRETLGFALKAVVERHSMLRARFTRYKGEWVQYISKDADASYLLFSHDIGHGIIQDSFPHSAALVNVETGPLLVGDIIAKDKGDRYLRLTAHHLVIDLVSWRIILHDLEEYLTQGTLGREKPLSFRSWLRLQDEHLSRAALPPVLRSFEYAPPNLEYWGITAKPLSSVDTQTHTFTLSTSLTEQIMKFCHSSLRTNPVDIMLAALLFSFGTVFNDRPLPTVFDEGHGRSLGDKAIDVSQTVGWFTVLFPILVNPKKNGTIVDMIRRVKDFRRTLAGHETAFFRNQILKQDNSHTNNFPVEILFNFFGQYQQLERADAILQQVPNGIAEDLGRQALDVAIFEVSVQVERSQLGFALKHGRRLRHQEKITKWVTEFGSILEMMARILKGRDFEYTLSDFPMLALDYQTLDTLVNDRLKNLRESNGIIIEDIYPCTPMQDGILASQARNSSLYRSSIRWKITADKESMVDNDRLLKAWSQVVKRHSILRTVFTPSFNQKSLFNQIVLEGYEPLTAIIFCDKNGGFRQSNERGASKDQFVHEHELTIYSTSSSTTVCELSINHALFDGASAQIILKDLILGYKNELVPHSGPLYKEYVRYLTQRSPEDDRAYWEQYLAGTPPCYFPCSERKQSDYAEQAIRLDPGLVQKIRKLCVQMQLTTANVVQLAWALVLRALTGSDSVCFGCLASGRDVPVDGIMDAVGVFVNMLVCRFEMDEGESLIQILNVSKKQFRLSLEHQQISLAEVHCALGLQGKHLFNTAISFERPSFLGATGEIQVHQLPDNDPNEYDVTLHVFDSPTAVDVALRFWKSRVSEDHMQATSKMFVAALSSITNDPQQDIGSVSISDAHYDRIFEWNKNIPAPSNRCLHDIFQSVVKEYPHNEAIYSSQESLSYRQLDLISSALALTLAAAGVSSEILVPICFEKSTWAVVAMLGVLKAGGGFVPLDPNHPPERHLAVIKNVEAKLVLGSRVTSAILRSYTPTVLEVSQETVNCSLQDCPTLTKQAVTPSNVAYIIFTSGSTGKPKGVVIEHRAVSSSCTEHAGPMGFKKSSRVLQFSSYTFDASIAEIFTTLTTGGTVCIPTERERMGDIVSFINKARVNWIFSTPSFIRTIEPSSVPTVRTLAVGGEIVGQDILSTWVPSVTFIHVYGPTECCIFSVSHTVNRDKGHRVILGRAFGSVSWIVDPRNPDKLLPVGSVGELLLEGPILARGYLNDPEKTAAAFIDSPVWLEGARRKMYRTGDLVRYNKNGTMMYIGRKDNQVKLRGQRLELGEIEYNMGLNLPEHIAVAVELVDRAGIEGSKALAAFVCDARCTEAVNDEDLLNPMTESFRSQMEDLRQKLDAVLPSYMVPSLYIQIKKMPPTPTGKLNRPLLRQLIATLSQEDQSKYSLMSDETSNGPSTEYESIMQGFWGQVLRMEGSNIGTNSNFFHLGGDSIAALHLVNIVRNNNLSIGIPEIFGNPTLKKMSRCLEAGGSLGASTLEAFGLLGASHSMTDLISQASEAIQVQSESILDIYPCTPLQEGLVALSNKRPGSYISQFVFSLPAHIDIWRFQKAWSLVIERTPILRTRIIAIENSMWQVVISEDIQWEYGDNLQLYLAQDQKLDMRPQSPLSRYALLREGNRQYFVLTMHHSVYDGWSLPMLFRNVENMYHQDGSHHSQPEFRTFIKHVTEIDRERGRNFWSQLLKGAKQSKFPQIHDPEYHFVVNKSLRVPIDLGIETQGDFTASTILQAAWAIVLSQITESTDITFGSVVSGRNAPVPGISEIIGPTIATLPVRVNLNKSQSISKLLYDIQQQAAQKIPFEQEGLQNISSASEDARAACQFLSLFVIQPLFVHSGAMLGCERVEMDYNIARATPLTMECSIGEGQLEVSAHFDSNLINQRKMELVIHQLAHTFIELSSGHQRTLLQITRCSSYERQLIKKWNENIPRAMETCVHHVFKKQVFAWPKAPAVHAWDYQLSYSQVDQYATAFAHYIVSMGVGPEVLVPVIMEKSAWTIVAMIGILKAGGACATLDPSHPTDRLHCIIQDTEAPLIVVSAQYRNRFSGLVDNTVVFDKSFLDELPSQIEDPRTNVCSSNAAFVIFTSGSTGKPKGIIIEHVHICTSSEAQGSTMNIGLDSRVFSFASYAFDVSLGDTWTTLMRGGCVCVPSEDDRLSNLAQTISEMRANWIGLTPTVSRLLTPESVPTVKTLTLGGEPLAKEDAETWAGHVRVINSCKSSLGPVKIRETLTQLLDGPAETVIGATMSDLSADRSLNPRTIGHGIDANLWVVDPDNHHTLVPIGTIGELLIQGPAISRGYLKDPEKTARSYLTEAPAFLAERDFGPNRTHRIFRTGDLVYQSPEDGAVIYVGRKDTQVKLHGQRIELQEIEEQLASNCGEEHVWAVELVQGSKQESACLAAFFSNYDAIGGREPEVIVVPVTNEVQNRLRKLKKHLASLLPEYMVPSMFAQLATMPLNTSGKTDRNRLRTLGAAILNEAGLKSTAAIPGEGTTTSNRLIKRQPATKKGQKMQNLWSRVLELPLASIGSLDNFFDLGGNSIVAMKLAASAHREGLSLSVADIFKYPQLDDISKIVTRFDISKLQSVFKPKSEDHMRDTIASQLPNYKNIQHIAEATDYQAWTAIHGMMAYRGFYNDLFVDFSGDSDISRIRQACHILVQHNPILRAAFVGHEDRILLVAFKDVDLDFQVYKRDGGTVTGAPLSWELKTVKYGKPPIRFALIEKSNSGYRLVIRISHAQYDGISVPLMLNDLKAAYTGLDGTSLSNYFDYLDEYARRKKVSHLAFWKQLLYKSHMTQIVAHDGLHHAGKTDTCLFRKISSPAVQGRTGITVATIFKAAWALVLSKFSGQKDVTFGHVSAGRSAYLPRFDTTIGAFLNIIPIRAQLDKDPNCQTSLQLMREIQDQHVDSLPHEWVGWRTILKSCTSWPSWSSFSSILQHQNLDHASTVTLPGIARIGASTDIWVLTTPHERDVDVQLYFSSHIPLWAAQEMLDKFCSATAKLCDPACGKIPVNDFFSTRILIPFNPLSTGRNCGNDISDQEAIDDDESSELFQKLRHLVENAWSKVLGRRENKRNFFLGDSYLELGGDLVTAGLLAHVFQEEGYHRATVEGIIAWTTIRGQIRYLIKVA
ncbi:hypothetical protein LOZ66_002496 [Ophidiomyces ophidiicola]|nr:hypothetical protein LOZ66_002496 [Ophidiomyces ophidiicola]